ncbi:MAG: dihydrolipoyl dehydrogenase [Syntrophales bacterium]|jgi:dihydrolipoamide dehydrogenase|nr:dihydrolipoyl dehydrogenase [Syntrophales bacterium]MDY0045405.1 dihydrolipoyl dehydrogenase [Syntrophales bacterium]
MEFHYDVAVIGSGPGGYVAAIRASQLGLKTAVIEKSEVGGVCANWGCIPSKAIINQAKIYATIPVLEHMGITADKTHFDYEAVYRQSRAAAERLSKGILFLLKKNKIDLLPQIAKITGTHEIQLNDTTDVVTAKHIIIATGSHPKEIPGFTIDEENILSSTGMLKLKKLPKSVIILGAGAIGLEFAYILHSFGAKVIIVEMLESLFPAGDEETCKGLQRVFKKKKIEIFLRCMAVEQKRKESLIEVTVEKEGKLFKIAAEKILVSAGRSPNSKGIGIENLGLKTEKGFIVTDENCKTTIENIFAIGDVINTPQLAHVASREGEIAAEYIAGHKAESRTNNDEIPYGIYCEPQLGGFGMTEKEAAKRDIPFEKAVFPYRASGKAVAVNDIEGMVKIIFDKGTEKILGAHILGAEATELIHEALLAKKSGLRVKDLASMIHAHPTLSENIMEAARAGEGRAVHI